MLAVPPGIPRPSRGSLRLRDDLGDAGGLDLVGRRNVTSATSIHDIESSGWGGTNLFVQAPPTDPVNTPFIPNLRGGANQYGLLEGIDSLSPELKAVREGAPSDALAALLRMDTGPAGYDWDLAGFDMLLFINLLDRRLDAPMLGVGLLDGDAPRSHSLLFRDEWLGPDSTLEFLSPWDIWVTLIPEGDAQVRASAAGYIVTGVFPAEGDVVYLSSAPPVPAPSALFLVTSAVAACGLFPLRRHRS